MNWFCRIFGHKWDQSKPISRAPEQFCTRKNCLVSRTLAWNQFPKIGEPAFTWEIIDIDKIKIK